MDRLPSPHSPPRLFTIRKVIVSLVLGVVLNVIMAIVAASLPFKITRFDHSPTHAHLNRQMYPGKTAYTLLIAVPDGMPVQPIERRIEEFMKGARATTFEPGFDQMFLESSHGYQSTSTIDFECWGFPFRSFWCWNASTLYFPDRMAGVSKQGGNLRLTDAGYAIASLFGTDAGAMMVRGDPIPFYPLWPGVIANTSIYTGLCLGVWTGLPAARRALRRRRGHCPMCNYNLTGNATGRCPECGHVDEIRKS